MISHEQILDSLNTLVCQVKDGYFIYLNPQWSVELGWSLSELKSKPFIEFVYPDDRAQTKAIANQQLTEGREISAFRNRYLHKDGRLVTLEWTSVAETQDTISATATVADEKIKLEKQLARATRFEAIGTLTAGICHDLNNVLAIIAANAELLKAMGLNETQRPFFNNIEEAVCRATNVTGKLLKASKSEPASRTTFVLDQELSLILELLQGSTPSNISIALKLNAPRRVSIAKSDFADAIINLMINAQKAISHHGSIQLKTEVKRHFEASAHFVYCVPATASEYILVSIADTGCGIEKDKFEAIFTPFVTERTDGSGSGLGLSMVARFAGNNKLGLSLTSEPGRGSTFYLWLPVHDEAPNSVPARHLKEPEPATSNVHIVLIDDEATLLTATQRLLESIGMKVTAFEQADVALAFVQQNHTDIDMVISDEKMTGPLQGHDIVQRLQRDIPALKTAIMTGYSADAQLQKLTSHIIQKPIRLKALNEIIRDILES